MPDPKLVGYLVFGGGLHAGVIVRLLPDWRRPKPKEEELVVTREKLLWENAIDDVRTQIRVVNSLRRARVHHY